MNKFNALILMTGFLAQLPLAAQEVSESEFDGAWEGVLALDVNTSMTLKFAINIEDEGNRVVRLSSPDNGALTNIRATSVEVNEQRVALEFSSLNGKFDGVLENQTLTGEWQQAGTNFPLTLNKLAEQTMSADDLAVIIGDWTGILATPRGDQPIGVRFESSEDGSLGAIGLSPAGIPGGPPMTEITLVDSELRFVMRGLIYKGTMTSGTEIEGELTRRNGVVETLNLSKK